MIDAVTQQAAIAMAQRPAAQNRQSGNRTRQRENGKRIESELQTAVGNALGPEHFDAPDNRSDKREHRTKSQHLEQKI